MRMIGAVKNPLFAALAREGVRFTQACSVAPRTLPSHASMLKGLYPTRHTVRDNG
jgi:arylsulfatase A-like enzyme